MTVSLVVMALWTSSLLAAGAWAVDRLLRSVRVQTRVVWLVAMVMSVVLVVAAPLRLWWGSSAGAIHLLPELVIGATTIPRLADAAADVAGRLPKWTDTAVLSLWIASVAVTLLVFLASYRRQMRLAAIARRGVVAGSEVRVTEALGPAVIGVLHPSIVVPRWLLTRTEEEQRLVVAHEREHIVSRDPPLLLLAAAMVVLMPWNPALWWGFSRLRLAAELDCDLRVLRGGAPPLAYGTLLLDLTAVLPRTRAGVTAFAARPSQLERRLLAMTTRTVSSTRRLVSIGIAALLAGGTAFVACTGEVKEPSSANDGQLRAIVHDSLPFFDFQVEKAVAMVAGSAAPRYPDILRSAGVEGEVLVQFVVDTTGRVEMESYKLIRSSHDLFDISVHRALQMMLFTPAEVQGRKVRQLVQQPFVFQLAR